MLISTIFFFEETYYYLNFFMVFNNHLLIKFLKKNSEIFKKGKKYVYYIQNFICLYFVNIFSINLIFSPIFK